MVGNVKVTRRKRDHTTEIARFKDGWMGLSQGLAGKASREQRQKDDIAMWDSRAFPMKQRLA